MSVLEVRANLSFDGFRSGRFYQVDGEDPRVKAQIFGGYFTVVNVLEAGDVAPPVDVDSDSADRPGDHLDSGVVRPKKRKKVTGGNGEGEHLPGQDDSVQSPEDVASGQPDS